jgi:glycosyl transferase family 25
VVFDFFDEIRVVNLPTRRDRRARMLGELRKVGLENDPRVAFFDALTFANADSFSSRGARGAFHSQLEILEQAAQRRHSVLILEDDLDFIKGAQTYELEGDWAIFYGGYYADDPKNLQKSDIVGAHMMGFSADIVPKVAAYLRSLQFTGTHPPIDGAYVWFRRENPDVTTLFARPPLGNQRPSRSDIADLRFYDKLPVLKQGMSIVRSAKRALSNFFRPSLLN